MTFNQFVNNVEWSVIGKLYWPISMAQGKTNIASIESSRISSGYGMRDLKKNGEWKLHRGVDFRASGMNRQVLAMAKGTVHYSGWHGDFGNVVIIKHEFMEKSFGNYTDPYAGPRVYNVYTLYAHLEKSFVKRKERVEAGRIIGKMGNTGRSSGVHLHFEIITGKNFLDASAESLFDRKDKTVVVVRSKQEQWDPVKLLKAFHENLPSGTVLIQDKDHAIEN